LVVNQGLTVRQQTLYRLEVIRFSAFLFINDVKRNALQRKASAGARRVKQMRRGHICSQSGARSVKQDVRGRICSQSGARSVKQDVRGTSCSPSGEQKPPCTRRRRGLRIVRPDRKRQGSFTPSLLLSHDDPLRWARHGYPAKRPNRLDLKGRPSISAGAACYGSGTGTGDTDLSACM